MNTILKTTCAIALVTMFTVSNPDTASARGYSTTGKISNCMNSSNALARNDAMARGTYCNDGWNAETAYWRTTFSSRPSMGMNRDYSTNQRNAASAEHTNSKNTQRN